MESKTTDRREKEKPITSSASQSSPVACRNLVGGWVGFRKNRNPDQTDPRDYDLTAELRLTPEQLIRNTTSLSSSGLMDFAAVETCRGLRSYDVTDPDRKTETTPNFNIQSWNDVGWNNPMIKTPNLNVLAREGVILERSYVSPLCSPSRAALLTGMYPFKLGMQHGVIKKTKPHGLPLNVTILPEKLRQLGYSTHIIGKGFDTFFGFYSGQADYYKHKSGKERGYDFRFNKKVYKPRRMYYSTTLFRKHAVNIINHHNKRKPLFLYLPFQSVHSPLQNGGTPFYGGNNWPLRGGKATLWEGGTRVPSFVWGKMLNRTHYVNKQMIHVVDWYPTLLALAGGKPVSGIDGVNQWETLSNNLPSKRTEFVYSINQISGRAAIRMGKYKLIEGSPGHYRDWYPPQTDRKATVKIERSQNRVEDRHRNYTLLYDVENDPIETNNLSAKYPHIVERLRKRLAEYKKDLVEPFNPRKIRRALPKFWGGIWSPGWC
ncbi:hypothetical protein LSH36_175g04045 [Paralvinella palmiformis]|uniref:Sulfatase N-terminal domain-containing protein n=1 Tax=Paralvinella palmiformis TaxID=53620 RepID=A0AAD9JTZ2_9ANNE|nr:hypothetical protein LSH36_175g04045 [Paralvinella palmiformis]